jgi:invasion protein IalB
MPSRVGKRQNLSKFGPAAQFGCALLAALAFAPLGAAESAAQSPSKGAAAESGKPAAAGPLKGKYGDWEIRCDTPPGATTQQCALIQSVVADDKPDVNLVVLVLKINDGKNRLLRVIAPLGVLLPNGLGLFIDETNIGTAGFVKCLPSGCLAEVVMDDKLVDQLKSGKTATFVIRETPDEGIGLPLTLAGFKEGFAKLP